MESEMFLPQTDLQARRDEANGLVRAREAELAAMVREFCEKMKGFENPQVYLAHGGETEVLGYLLVVTFTTYMGVTMTESYIASCRDGRLYYGSNRKPELHTVGWQLLSDGFLPGARVSMETALLYGTGAASLPTFAESLPGVDA